MIVRMHSLHTVIEAIEGVNNEKQARVLVTTLFFISLVLHLTIPSFLLLQEEGSLQAILSSELHLRPLSKIPDNLQFNNSADRSLSLSTEI